MLLHNVGYLILSFILLSIALLSDSNAMHVFIILLTIVNLLILRKLNIKLLTILLLFMLPLGLSLYFAGLFFSKLNAVSLMLNLVLRMLVISISSILLFAAINFEELILYFMQRCRLPVILGYPLISAINTFKNFKDEYIRVNNAYLMRYAKRFTSYKIIYPLLISATRYAFSNGLSMECRGLNKDKTFVTQVICWQIKDSIYILINVIIIVFAIIVLR